jgi:hypothetical protein
MKFDPVSVELTRRKSHLGPHNRLVHVEPDVVFLPPQSEDTLKPLIELKSFIEISHSLTVFARIIDIMEVARGEIR